jgi:hypothetical protein
LILTLWYNRMMSINLIYYGMMMYHTIIQSHCILHDSSSSSLPSSVYFILESSDLVDKTHQPYCLFGAKQSLEHASCCVKLMLLHDPCLIITFVLFTKSCNKNKIHSFTCFPRLYDLSRPWNKNCFQWL